MELALFGFIVLFVLIFAGLPITYSMATVGTLGLIYLIGIGPASKQVGQIAMDTVKSYSLSVLPLFLLMGNLIARSGLADDLYDMSNKFIGHYRGGLAMATILASGGFSAVSGSSIATAATMARIAMPPMRKRGYSDPLAAGSVAAGGTLGILIPPSVVLVIYGNLTESDIGALFIGAIIPGLLGLIVYLLVAYLYARWSGENSTTARASWGERMRSLGNVWAVAALFMLVIGGIYGGIFSPTEAAGIGATGALVIALQRRSLSMTDLISVLVDTAQTTGILLILIIGSVIFSAFVNIAGMSAALVSFIQGSGLPPIGVIAIIVLIYLVLGALLESFSMILLTVPIFFPVVTALGYDPIWFGIIVVVATEISLITPPHRAEHIRS